MILTKWINYWNKLHNYIINIYLDLYLYYLIAKAHNLDISNKSITIFNF